MPDANARARLSDLIHRFAERWKGPVFEPHITLLGDLSGAPDRTIAKCDMLFASTARQNARVLGADGGEAFYKSLYLNFDDTIENVEGARAAGLQSVHVQSPAHVKQALVDIGLI
jgi:hypothetical protein